MQDMSIVLRSWAEPASRPLKLSFNRMFSVYIALLPILSIYNVPFLNNNLGYYLRILFGPFLVTKLIGKKWLCKDTVFIYAFFLYWFWATRGDYVHYFIFFSMCIVYILAIYNGIFDMKTFSSAITVVTIISCALVLLQLGVFSLFKYHIQMVIIPLTAENVRMGYLYYWQNGHSVGSSVYRPSAFFFEPAHLCQYCFVGLAVTMKKWADKKGSLLPSVFIILGMLATKSSQGIAFAAGVIIWAVFIRGDKRIIKRMIITLLFIIISCSIIYFLYIQGLLGLDFILGRVFGEVDGYNAIAGRNFANSLYLGQLSGISRLVGIGYVNRPEVYMTGINVFRYTIGIIGCVLLYLMLAWSIRDIRGVSACIAVAFGALFCIAQATSSQAFIFYVGISYAQTRHNARKRIGYV